MVKSIIAIAVVLGGVSSFAAEGLFYKTNKCGTYVVESGDACANLKVKLDFKGCGLTSEPQYAKKVLCEGDNAKVRFQEGDYRYQVVLKKKDDGWGGVTWDKVEDLYEYKRKAKPVPAPVEAKKPVEEPKKEVVAPAPTPVATSTPAVVAQAPAAAPAPAPAPVANVEAEAPKKTEKFKFGFFADFRFTDYSLKDHPTISSGYPESGFGLEDGALYANFEEGQVSAVLDIPFRRGKDVDLDSAAAKPNQSSNGNFTIGADKAQAYIRYKLKPEIALQFGQFDTLFGVELNDSKDRVFNKAGLVYDYTLPVTHTGALIEFAMNGFYAKLFAANPNNKGSFGSTTSNDDKTEYGTALGFSNENYRIQIGAMARPISKANGDIGQRTLVDATAGVTFGSFSADFEYNQISDPSKNTITTTDNTDLEDSAVGQFALLSYSIGEKALVGARFEQVKNDPTLVSIKTADSAGLAVHYKLSSELKIKAETMAYNYKTLSDVKWKENRSSLGFLLSF